MKSEPDPTEGLMRHCVISSSGTRGEVEEQSNPSSFASSFACWCSTPAVYCCALRIFTFFSATILCTAIKILPEGL